MSMNVLLVLNFLVMLLIRLLIKYNIFSVKIGVLTIFLQIIVGLSLPFISRTTSLSEIPFNYFLGFFLIIAISPVALLLIFHLLGDKRKSWLVLENKLTAFLYQMLGNIQTFFLRNSFYKRLENIFSKYLTIIFIKIIWLGKENLFILFFFLPWSTFVISYFYDLYHQFFYWSIYFLAYFFFFSRLLWVLLFLVKNTVWSLFNDLLHQYNTKLYFGTVSFSEILWIDEKFISNLIFPVEKSLLPLEKKEDFVSLWKVINQLIYFHNIFIVIKILWRDYYPKIRLLFYLLNFLVILLGIVVFFLPVSLVFFILVSPFLIFFRKFFKVSFAEQKFNGFCENFDLFMESLRNKLMVEKDFSCFDAKPFNISFLKMPPSVFSQINRKLSFFIYFCVFGGFSIYFLKSFSLTEFCLVFFVYCEWFLPIKITAIRILCHLFFY